MVSSMVRNSKDETELETRVHLCVRVCVCVMPAGCLISAAGQLRTQITTLG